MSLDKKVRIKFQKASLLGSGSPNSGPVPDQGRISQGGGLRCSNGLVYIIVSDMVIFVSNEKVKLCALKILTSVRTFAATRMPCVRMNLAVSRVNATPVMPATDSPAVGGRISYIRFCFTLTRNAEGKLGNKICQRWPRTLWP